MEMELASLVILMSEAEQPEGLSARKLVVETAKHNVLTGYNAKEGLSLLRRFPNVDAILIHGMLLRADPNILADVKAEAGSVPVIVACPFGDMCCPEADYIVDSHNPQDLLRLLTEEISARFQV